MRRAIYLIVGTPGSGKTWVCNQLEDQYNYLPHDDFAGQKDGAYVMAAARLADFSDKPVLIETPFSVSKIREPLLKRGFDVVPVFIIESEAVTSQRYEKREGKQIIPGHLSRIKTYIERAAELNAFSGTSEEVLKHMKEIL